MNSQIDYLVIIAIILILSLAIRVVISNRNFDIFEPFYLINIVYFLVFCVAPAIWISHGQTSKGNVEIMQGLPKASIIFILGYICFCIGDLYVLKKVNINKNLEKKSEIVDKTSNRQSLAFFSQVGIVLVSLIYAYALKNLGKSFISQFTLGIFSSKSLELSYSDTVYEILKGVCICYAPLLCTLLFTQRSKRIIVYIEYVFVCILYIGLGYRYILLILIMAPIIVKFIYNDKRPKIRQLIKYLLIIFFVVALIGVTRDSIRQGKSIQKFHVQDMIDTILPNIEVFFPYYKEVLVVPQSFSFSYGVSFLYIIYQFIPRSIWVTKPYPPYPQLRDFMFGAYGKIAQMEYVNVGEFYLNFGTIGVCIGMLIFGYFIQKSTSLYKKDKNLLNIIEYSILYTYLIQYLTRGDFANVALQIFYLFIPIFILKSVKKYKIVWKK